MQHTDTLYIGGAWIAATNGRPHAVVNPSTEEVVATVTLGSAADVDRAVQAARRAFVSYSRSTRQERIELLEAIIAVYQRRVPELAAAVSVEMGAPLELANRRHAPSGLRHLNTTLAVLRDYQFEERLGSTLILREPFGVCGFITPWNWPINQIMCKLAPALAAGCTCVLKPSEMAPLSAILIAEILHEAGVPAGVFNLVHGDGATVGEALVAHPGIDLISFTGSTKAGIRVAKLAADSVKRVAQELGGKSANLILDDAELPSAVRAGVLHLLENSGQSCNAPSRMFVHRRHYGEAIDIAVSTVESVSVGEASAPGVRMGPLSSRAHCERVQSYIRIGMEEGARIVTGGLGRPNGCERGFFTRPTIFADVRPGMQISREEIFGPVLCMIPYDDEDEAIRMANDTSYGLSGYVSSSNADRARRVAGCLRTGMVHINNAPPDAFAPFGGYKQSGNGREWGRFGFEEFLEIKAVTGSDR